MSLRSPWFNVFVALFVCCAAIVSSGTTDVASSTPSWFTRAQQQFQQLQIDPPPRPSQCTRLGLIIVLRQVFFRVSMALLKLSEGALIGQDFDSTVE